MRKEISRLFITPTGTITPATFFIMVGLPVLFSGKIFWGTIIICIGVTSGMRASLANLNEVDRQEIRYNLFDPKDIIAELLQIEQGQQFDENIRSQCLASLAVLAKKYTKQHDERIDLPLLCQQASYICLRMSPENDSILAGAISLLALVAKRKEVRERNKFKADEYGLDLPIKALTKALDRSKHEENESKEELLAEIQRKGALYLGALADGDKDFDLPIKIVEEDGLELILSAANWYRYHEGVANWALWAIFVICYEQVRNKMQLVRLGGISLVCELMKNNKTCLEVNRHGVAILFDLLREGNEEAGITWNPWEIRKSSLNAGLHDVLVNAMTQFSEATDIMMMGQEMLIGTGYRGNIPQAKDK